MRGAVFAHFSRKVSQLPVAFLVDLKTLTLDLVGISSRTTNHCSRNLAHPISTVLVFVTTLKGDLLDCPYTITRRFRISLSEVCFTAPGG